MLSAFRTLHFLVRSCQMASDEKPRNVRNRDLDCRYRAPERSRRMKKDHRELHAG